MRPPTLLALPLVLSLVACGAAAPPPASPAGEPVAPAPATTADPGADAPPAPLAPAPPLTLPTACSPGGDGQPCTPPGPFADALCNAHFPDLTLTLFAKGSPWTRAYLRGDVDGWYASGGGSARARLLFDEEVLVLRVRAAATSGVVVGNGSTSYDVLRWDGLCYTVDSGELTMKRPPKPKHAALAFHRLGDATQAALLKDDKVRAARSLRGKECHGAMTGEVTLACEKADHGLAEAVVGYVSAGGALPPPSRLPGG